MQTFWHDLTSAARLLRRSPGFTVAAVLTLAIGIGANATIFSFADALLLQPLPVADADRVVHVFQRRLNSTARYPLSYADYLDYRERTHSFEVLAAHYPTSPMHVVVDGDPYAANGAVVTANYFEALRLRPAAGRFFLAHEDQVRDRDAVAVVSHRFSRRFGEATTAIGRVIRINDHPFTIVGVAPETFTGVHNGGTITEVWIPTAMFRVGYRFCDAFRRDCTIIDMLGRLKPGVSITQAQQELGPIAAQLAADHPSSNANTGVLVTAARGRGYGALSDPRDARQLQLFLVAVGLVLLIGCANVAGLLFARAIRRRKEIAVRFALGATRMRLVRQLLTESVLLAVLGGGLGLLLAIWAKDFVAALNAADYAGRPLDFRLGLSPTVFVATTAITVVASLLCGLIPALQGSRSDVIPVLKDEGASGGARRARLRQTLVIGQIALAVTLMIGAGLLVRSFRSVLAGPGFDPRPLITLRLRPALVGYPTDKALAFQREVIARLEALPGVISASPADGIAASPLIAPGNDAAIVRGERGQQDQQVYVRQTRVGPRYFATLGVAMLEGREFDDRDQANAPKVVVINDVLARSISRGEPSAGRTLVMDGISYQIVGVVKDAQYYAAGDQPHAVAYRSYWQPSAEGGFNKDSRTVVRVAGDAAALMSTIRRTISAVDPAVPISEDYPLSSRLGYEFQSVNMAQTMIGAFAIVALLLSAIGLYGVVAFTVAHRTREIGVRMALGASRRDVASLVLFDGLLMAFVGAVLGLLGAWGLARFVGSLLYGVESHDPIAFLVAPAAVVIVAIVVSYLPARRAARLSPVTALRYE